MPYESTAARLPDLIDDVKVVPVEEGRHNIGWTHPEVVKHSCWPSSRKVSTRSTRLDPRSPAFEVAAGHQIDTRPLRTRRASRRSLARTFERPLVLPDEG